MEKLGILAGAGKLPVECARVAQQLGYEVYAVGLLDETDEQLSEFAKDFQKISIGQLDAILNYLTSNQLQKVTMIDKVVEMSKINIGGEEIEGAKIQVINKDTKEDLVKARKVSLDEESTPNYINIKCLEDKNKIIIII